MRVYDLFHLEKQIMKRSGPGLLKLFVNKRQFPKDVAVAQAMATGKFKIGCPTIMDEDAFVGKQQPEGSDGFSSPLGMDAIPGDQFCRDDMEPVKLAHHARSGFISMGDLCLQNVTNGSGLKGGEGAIGFVHGGLDGGIAYALPEEIFAHLADAFDR